MKLPSKNSRIALLMIISQALLVGFTLYWLSGQFKVEKTRLVNTLNNNYKASYEIVLDSLLVKNYITPALGDSAMQFKKFITPGRGIIMSDSFRIRTGNDSETTFGTSTKSILTIDLNSKADSLNQSNISEIRKIENEMLLRSVRLIVQHVDDSSSMHIRTMHGVENGVDSALFVSSFESGLEREAIDLQPIWTTKADVVTKGDKQGKSMVVGGWIEEVPSLTLKGYHAYLYGQILPQILFVVILILLTGSAFIISYRSLRKQTLLNEMRNSFIGNISHELKTPVSTIKVAIEAMRNFDLKRETGMINEYLAMSAKEIKRLELLITKVLDNSIIEQDKSILRFETVDLGAVISDAIESLTPKIKDANAEVNLHMSNSIEMEADPLYLQGVIINLIDNSLKYGNGNPVVDIEVSTKNETAYIVVSDNGPGIPPQFLKKVFDKFFRIPTSDIHNVKGYGLGLSFAALIIDMHDGSIDVENRSKGCAFSIKLPMSRR